MAIYGDEKMQELKITPDNKLDPIKEIIWKDLFKCNNCIIKDISMSKETTAMLSELCLFVWAQEIKVMYHYKKNGWALIYVDNLQSLRALDIDAIIKKIGIN